MKSKLKILGLFITLAFFTLIFLTQLPKYQLFIIYSGSMEPNIPKGSVVIAKNPKETDLLNLKIGDIITFFPKKNDPNTLVTHRINKINNAIYTKGDSNPQPDLWPLQSNQIKGIYAFDIPHFGYLLHFLKIYPWYLAVILGLIITFPLDKNFLIGLKLNKRQFTKALALFLPFLIIFWANPALAQWNKTLYQTNHFATDSINKYLSISAGTSLNNTGLPVATDEDYLALDFGTLNKPTTFSNVLLIKNISTRPITIQGASDLTFLTLGFGVNVLETITLNPQETTLMNVTINPQRKKNQQLYLGEIALNLNGSNFYVTKIPTKFFDK